MAFNDGTISYNKVKNLWITITHLPSSNVIQFKGMVTKFNDSYESKWNSEEVYGRSDPLETFQTTSRMISLGWVIPAATLDEARGNLANCAQLARFMYPTYGKGTNALVAPPLLSIKFANLVQQIEKKEGLVGRLSGFNYTPNFDADGVFDLVGEIFPKTVEVELEFRVFHTHELGWNEEDKQWRSGGSFPYFTEDTGGDKSADNTEEEELSLTACKDAQEEFDAVKSGASEGSTEEDIKKALGRAKDICAKQGIDITGGKP